MPRTEPFRDLAEFRAEKARVKVRVDHHSERLESYWTLLHDAEFRHGLANSALEDLIRSWRPLRMVGSLFRSEQSTLTAMLVSFLQPNSRSWKGRLLSWGIGILAPILISRLAHSERIQELVSRFTSAGDADPADDDEEKDSDDLT